MHDWGHHSLFQSRWLNRVSGFLLGLVNGVPQLAWARDHADHHRTNDNWDQYHSVIDMPSVDELLQLSPLQQRIYAILGNRLMAFPGGFYYLAIKPRLDLVVGADGQGWREALEGQLRKDSICYSAALHR